MAQPVLDQFAVIKSEEMVTVSTEDKKIVAQVNYEVDDMERYAEPARSIARDAITGYMAFTHPPSFGRSNLFIPKVHAIVYARMAMEAASLPKVEYKARNENSKMKMPFINAAKDNAETGDGNLRPDSLNLWFHQNFDKILFGTGFRYLSYLYQKRIVKYKDENGKVKEKSMIVYDDIWDEVPDFFNVGVSRDMLPGMFGGSACYMDKFFKKDAFVERFDNEFYTNVKEAAMRTDWIGEDFNWDVPDGYVRVRYYWNIFKDLMVVQANGLPIRIDFIQDYGATSRLKKFLPITSIHNDISFGVNEPSLPSFIQSGRQYATPMTPNSNRSFWSKSDVLLVKGLIGFSNAIWRAAVDHTKASSVHFLMAQSSGVYDQIRSADLYGIVPLKNADGNSFDVKSLVTGGDYLNKFTGMEESVDNLMTHALGNDWKRAASELTNEKATVAAIRQQVQRIRMNQNQKYNESGGIKRHYRILLNLIEQYYTEKTMKELGDEEVPEGVEEEDIVRDSDGKPYAVRVPKDIPFDEDIGFITKDGTTKPTRTKKDGIEFSRKFPGIKELLVAEEEPEIYIEPGSTFAELKAIDRALIDEKMSRILQFMSITYPNPQTGQPEPLISREGAKYALEQYAKAWDDDAEKFIGKEESDPDEEFEKEMTEPFNFTELPKEVAQVPNMGQEQSPQGIANTSIGGQMAGLASEITP